MDVQSRPSDHYAHYVYLLPADYDFCYVNAAQQHYMTGLCKAAHRLGRLCCSRGARAIYVLVAQMVNKALGFDSLLIWLL